MSLRNDALFDPHFGWNIQKLIKENPQEFIQISDDIYMSTQ